MIRHVTFGYLISMMSSCSYECYIKYDERISDVVATSQVEDEPCCCILYSLKTLGMGLWTALFPNYFGQNCLFT